MCDTMSKIIFAFDIDGTAIFSKNRIKSDFKDKICVEHINGIEFSFMSKKESAAYIELCTQFKDRVMLLPITSRSVSQYKQINWPSGISPQFAITTNGANLLENGVSSLEWHSSFLNTIEKTKEKRNNIAAIFSGCEGFKKKRNCDDTYDVFLFDTRENAFAAAEQLNWKDNSVNVTVSGRKVYAIPAGILKETALLKLKKTINPCFIISAGDSPLDIGFLSMADYQIATSSLLLDRFNPQRAKFSRAIFSTAKEQCSLL